MKNNVGYKAFLPAGLCTACSPFPFLSSPVSCLCARVHTCTCVRVWAWECCTPASIWETSVGNQRTEDKSLAPVASCFSAVITAGSTPQTTSSCSAAPCRSSSSSYPTSETMLPSDALSGMVILPQIASPQIPHRSLAVPLALTAHL